MWIPWLVLISLGLICVIIMVNGKKKRAQSQREKERQQQLPPDLPDDALSWLKAHRTQSASMDTKLKDEELFPVGDTRFGGRPDLPDDIAWPYHEGKNFKGEVANRPLTFFAQVDCADVAEYNVEGLMPDSGILYFFYELDTMEWNPGDGMSKITYARVLYYSGSKSELRRRDFPDDLIEEYRVPAAEIVFERRYSLPEYWDFKSGHPAMKNHEANEIAYDKMRAELGFIQRDEITKMFGVIDAIQDDFLDTDNWVLLLQIDSQTLGKLGKPSIMFGDLGRVYFYIHKEDLTQKTFESALLQLQCY